MADNHSDLAQRAGAAVLIAAGLSACAFGPDFRTPPPPAGAADRYTPMPLPARTVSAAAASPPALASASASASASTSASASQPAPASALASGRAAQQFSMGEDIPAQWWAVFRSPALDQLIRSALAQNPTMAAAEAALRQAQENYRAQVGDLLWPAVSGQLGVARQKANPVANPGASGVFNLYNASVNVSYTQDVFGATRRTLEAARATVDYQRFQVEATYLALSANVVTAAIQQASLRAQLQATREVLDALNRQLDVIAMQFEFGAIPRTTVLTQRNQVAQVAATVPPLEKALAQSQHQLSVLAGRLPSEAGMPEFSLAALTLPEALPVSLPSALVRQRPDIRASEELLHQASALIGVATAAQYPQVTLSGSYGSASTSFGNLLDAKSGVWSVAAGLAAPIFNGGALRAQRRAAEAAYDAAAAQYRTTVLTAFQNVADTLRALDADAQALKTQAESEALAAESLALATGQYKLGAISYLVLLDAQRSYQQAHIDLVRAQAARYADTAALFQALGGGWWNRAAGAPAAGVPAAGSRTHAALPRTSQNAGD